MAVLWPQRSASIEDPFELVNPGEPLDFKQTTGHNRQGNGQR